MTPACSGRKRSLEVLQTAFYAKYGVTDGVLETFANVRLHCSILCCGWPGWAVAAKLRGWMIDVIVVKDSDWVDCIKCWFPDSSVVLFENCVKWTSIGVSSTVWFSDADPPRKLSLWDTDSKLIITRRRARRAPSHSWSMTTTSIAHTACGGVTDGRWTFYVYSRIPSPHLTPVETVGGRDLSTVFDTKVQGIPCPPPTALVWSEPVVVEIRPNTYHGNGILPWDARLSFVVAPCIFSPTNWVRRRVQGSEMLKILDVPDSICEILSSSQVRTICQDVNLIPTKVLCSLIDSVPNFEKQQTGQGSSSKRLRETVDAEVLSPPLAQDMGGALEYPGGADGERTLEERVKEAETRGSSDRNTKATKSDDAEIPTYLWDLAIFPDITERELRALNLLREAGIRWWRRKVFRCFKLWFHNEYTEYKLFRCTVGRSNLDAEKSLVAGRECIVRSSGATWWEWRCGSRPFFWRWPKEYRHQIRDGLKLWIKHQLPKWQVPQRHESDALVRGYVRNKLITVRERGYIAIGFIIALTSYFSVPKGDDDIRVVYDGTKSGLNAALWAPWFPLPTIEGHLRAVEAGYYMGDLDIGEMFLNFILDEEIQQYAGVDLTPYFPDELTTRKIKVLWERWTRCAMGFTTSPYQAVQGVLFADEVIRGDRLDPTNISDGTAFGSIFQGAMPMNLVVRG